MQSEEYLAAHRIMQQQEKRIAELEAQVAELQGDVSRLTIENIQVKQALEKAMPAPKLGEVPTISVVMAGNDTAAIDEKPAKKSRAK